MKTYVEAWEFQPDKCLCDQYFIEWLDQGHAGNRVFHMGTGAHHLVGSACALRHIACYGLTASLDEFASWLNDGERSASYQVSWQDIYEIDPRLLPEFTTMTLFHLGEMVDKFGAIKPDKIYSLIEKVIPGGYVLFYNGSSAWDRTEKFVQLATLSRFIEYEGQYKFLEIYRRAL